MDKTMYDRWLRENEELVNKIRKEACELHASVGQTYGDNLPYGYHLTAVAEAAMQYGAEVVTREEDIVALVFGAFFHDSIEDARLTYNDVTRTAAQYMTEEQAHLAAEIAYALTNEKGRTRAERANGRYYQGIRETPYAPFVKLCDRLANIRFSHSQQDGGNIHMLEVYKREWPHFLAAITVQTYDSRYCLPQAMLREIEQMVG